MSLTQDQLLFDLYKAYYKAIKHKSKKSYVINFQKNLHENLCNLRDELWNHTYTPLYSICFVINHPKKREVYAAAFKDRIVHHLYYDYTHDFFERTFINDSYSCIKKRGTNYGIERLKHHILSESCNYTKECYALKIDIKGYFMNINRNILLELVLNTIAKYKKIKPYSKMLDFEFIEYLTKKIVMLDPVENCINISPKSDYVDLPKSKMLSSTPSYCGLPIGNLTSQLFSNVYLNLLDQFVKRKLKMKHYGRYVDDAFIITSDKDKIKEIIPKIELFLNTELGLELQKGKTRIINVKYGVEFLGAFIKPFRTYISNQSLNRIKNTMWKKDTKEENIHSNISKFGFLSQFKTFNIRKELFLLYTE